MRITFVLVAISLLALGVLTLSIITLQDSPDALNVLTNITSDVASLCATIACWLAYLLIPKDFLGEKRGWLLTALALTLFTFGDMYWSYSEIILGIEVPLGSIADWAWTLAYFVLLAGIYFIYTGMYFETKQKYVIMTLTLVIAAVFGYYHITHLISEAHGFIELVQEGYILYDIILLGMLAVMLLPLIASHNRLMNVWLFFGLSFAARIIFDFLFAIMTAADLYGTGNPIDILYAVSYVLIVFSADSKIKMLPKESQK